MSSKYLLLLGSLLLAPTVAIAAEPAQVVAGNQSGPLTLTEAKQIVAKALDASGERQLRPGRAEFAGNGNVLVQVVNAMNLPIREVLVDAATRQLAAQGGRTASKG